jgi:hypothetical protein
MEGELYLIEKEISAILLSIWKLIPVKIVAWKVENALS